MIKQATVNDSGITAGLALKLWPENSLRELESEFNITLSSENAAVFLFFDGPAAAAFALCRLRTDYVEGTSGSPVGYLEGIFVDEGYRRQGIAKELLKRCESWAALRGCAEFASDCELHNAESLAFHLGAGFTEANRLICFTKKLDASGGGPDGAAEGRSR